MRTSSTRRLGHAYSVHGIGGNLGYIVAPIVSFALGSAFGWRFALAAMGAIGLIALGVIATQRALLVSHRATDAHLHTREEQRGAASCTRRSCCASRTSSSRRWRGSACRRSCRRTLAPGFDVPLLLATSALTAYLSGGLVGILAGGFLAAKTERHDRVAATGLLLGARCC